MNLLFTSSIRSANAALTAGVKADAGVALMGLYLCGDLASDGTLPARFGPTMTNAVAGLFTNSSINGRGALAATDATVRCLITSSAFSAAADVIISALVIPTLPLAAFSVGPDICSSSTIGANAMSIANGTTVLYSAGGQSHIVDGVTTHNITAGAHVISSTVSGSVLGKIGHGLGAPPFQSAIGAVVYLRLPSAGVVTSISNRLKSHFRM